MNIIEFKERLNVSGMVRTKAGECPVGIEVSYSKHVPGSAEISVFCKTSEWKQLAKVLNNRQGGLEVFGYDERGRALRLENARLKSHRGARAEFDCMGFTFGFESTGDAQSHEYSVEVRIPNTALARTSLSEGHSYLGTIQSKRKPDDGIRWRSPLGDFLIADFYHFESDHLHESDVLVRVSATELRHYRKGQPPLDLKTLADRVEEVIEEPIYLLSFLSRKQLHWFEIRTNVHIEGSNGSEWREFLRRREVAWDITEHQFLLADPLRLGGDGFDQLLGRLKSSAMKKWLLRAMMYCVASHCERSLETCLSMAYLAVESLFKAYGVGGKADKFNRGLRTLMGKAHINLRDLWPSEVRLGTACEKLGERRRKFIHEADAEDPAMVDKDCARLQFIVEGAILASLGCGREWIHRHAYDTTWLTRGS